MLETAKEVDSTIMTVVGNLSFLATAEENQKEDPEIDVIKDLRKLF